MDFEEESINDSLKETTTLRSRKAGDKSFSKNKESSIPKKKPSFMAKKILDTDGVRRALVRIAHEILEKTKGASDVALVALQKGGVAIGEVLCELIFAIEGVKPEFGTLDVSLYRDDISMKPLIDVNETYIEFDLNDKTIVLVDDVIYTGRTVRAALQALLELGRPKAIYLAELVDRGHRELPIRPDFVGKNLPTSIDEHVEAGLDGITIKRELK